MSDSTPHKVFLIPELLEMIFLEADMQTILRAQRVCRFWNAVIKTSPSLLKALFFEPETGPVKGQKRKINPLLVDKIWPELFRMQRQAGIDPVRVAAYRRPEASWRRMLTHQPPTYRMGVLRNCVMGREVMPPVYSAFSIKMDDSGLRLGHLYEKVKSGDFTAGQDALVLWERTVDLEKRERDLHIEREQVTSKWLNEVDVVVFRWDLCGKWWCAPETLKWPLYNWFGSAEECRRYECQFDAPQTWITEKLPLRPR